MSARQAAEQRMAAARKRSQEWYRRLTPPQKRARQERQSRETMRKVQKRYRERHRERLRERDRERYWAMTLEERRLRLKRRDREKLQAAQDRYRARNREKLLLAARARHRGLTPAQRETRRRKAREFERRYRARRAQKARRYYLSHKDRVKARNKRWAQANREKVRRSQRKWAAAHREKFTAWIREWYKRNPDRAREYVHRRRARLLGGGGSHTSTEWVDLVLTYQGCCAYCGMKGRLQQDHRIPLSRGGSDFISNILPACGFCNRSKGRLTEAEFRARLEFDKGSSQLAA